MRRVPNSSLLVAAVLCFGSASWGPSSVRAQESQDGANVAAEATRPRVALVLGGGGARGAAHIGVIRVLEEMRIPVDMVVGTSMGAIIGGLYAAGYDADQLESILASIDWSEALRDAPRRSVQPMRRKEEDLELAVRYRLGLHRSGPVAPPGAISGQHLQLLLRKVLLPVHDVHDFDRLSLPFRAVATDLATGERISLGDGDLALAIRSSMSVPGAFAPVHRDGRVYVDGAVVDNVPVDVARELGADVIIAISVSGDLTDIEDVDSAIAVSMQSSAILVANRTQQVLEQLGPEDVFVRVDLGRMSGGEFDRAMETIAPGEAAARSAQERLGAHSVDEATYARWKQRRGVPDRPLPVVRSIVIDDELAPRAGGIVRAQIRQAEGEELDLDRLEEDLDRLYAIGRFSLVDYSLVPAQGGVDLHLRPQEKSWGPTQMRFGLGLNDNFRGRNDYRITIETVTHGLDDRGREWRNRIDLGDPTGLRTEIYQPLDRRERWFVTTAALVKQRSFVLSVLDEAYAEYALRSLEGELFVGRNLGQRNEFAVGTKIGHHWLQRWVGLPGLADGGDFGRGQVVARFTRDSLDDFSLPSTGTRILLQTSWSQSELGSDEEGVVAAGSLNRAFHLGSHCVLLGLSGGGVLSGEASSADTFFLGGKFRLSGYPRESLIGNEFGLARMVYYDNRGLGDLALIGTPLYYGFSVEAGNVWATDDIVDLTDLRWSGSAFVGFDTLIGPIFLGYGMGEEGRDNIYFSVGPLFALGRDAVFGDL